MYKMCYEREISYIEQDRDWSERGFKNDRLHYCYGKRVDIQKKQFHALIEDTQITNLDS